MIPPTESSDRPRARILCVDDDMVLLNIYVRCLSPEFEVVSAQSGAAALELLTQDRPFAAVIVDLTMPGMSGSIFLAEARSRAPEMVRIMLTGCAYVGGAAEAVKTGQVFRFVTKPCSPGDLLQVVRDAVDHYHVLLRRSA